MKLATAAAFALFLASGLGGCSTLNALSGGSVASTVPVTTAYAEKMLTVAHQAYNTASQDILAAVASGYLHGTNASTVQGWYDKAGDALKAADKMDAVANAQGVVDKVTAANALIDQIRTIVPLKK